MDVVGPLNSLACVAAPYLTARVLWRIRMPWSVRLTVFLAVPAALVWWLATSGRGSLTEITSPGAALIVEVMLFGWVAGATRAFRRRLIARAGGEAGS
jgi:hypothetical protein